MITCLCMRRGRKGMNKSSSMLHVNLYTLGHLWLYIILEEKGYGVFN